MSAGFDEVGGDDGSRAGIVVGTEVDGMATGAEGAPDDGTALALAEPGFLCFFEGQKPS